MNWLESRLVKIAHNIDEYVVMQAQQRAGMFSHDVSNALQKYYSACHESATRENLAVANKWDIIARQIEQKILSFINAIDNRQYNEAKRVLKSIIGERWFQDAELWT